MLIFLYGLDWEDCQKINTCTLFSTSELPSSCVRPKKSNSGLQNTVLLTIQYSFDMRLNCKVNVHMEITWFAMHSTIKSYNDFHCSTYFAICNQIKSVIMTLLVNHYVPNWHLYYTRMGTLLINTWQLTLTVIVVTTDAQWEGMGDVGSARYEPALLPPMPDHKGFKLQ